MTFTQFVTEAYNEAEGAAHQQGEKNFVNLAHQDPELHKAISSFKHDPQNGIVLVPHFRLAVPCGHNILAVCNERMSVMVRLKVLETLAALLLVQGARVQVGTDRIAYQLCSLRRSRVF